MSEIIPTFSETQLLKQIIKYRIISIIGLGKNVGKTTTLNYMIKLIGSNYVIALTSIGRDGEKYDEVFGTPKPRIFVNSGTIIAIARNSLENTDISLEILETTDINTPLGKIVIIRALSAGFVELTGPSTNHELKQVFNKFEEFGSEVILVDGAVNRKSFAAPIITNATILATGAAISPNFEDIIHETKFIYDILSIPPIENSEIKTRVKKIDKMGIISKSNEITSFTVESTLDFPENLLARIDNQTQNLVVNGVLSNSLVERLLSKLSPHQNLTIIIPDSTKIFLDRKNFNQIQKTSWKIRVINPINLLCITVNPMSPLGYEFDPEILLGELRKRIPIPVIDVYHQYEK